jgi:MFS family permease
MPIAAKNIIRTYLLLTMLSTLATSLIWGIDTLFLLDAGLSISQIFIINSFFMVGQLVFEVPTGIVADSKGRKLSFLLGTITLAITTGLYYFLWSTSETTIGFWMLTTTFLGLGFTFFSGATEAWLVDALQFTAHKGSLESVFAKGQIVTGIAMLSGSVAGGFIAQFSNLGVPYIVRASILVITFIVGLVMMQDLGFEPDKSRKSFNQIKYIWKQSLEHGIKNRPVRWLILSGPFVTATGFFTFYALQPYLLKLYGNPEAYGVAGLAAAIVAGAQIGGGILVPYIRKIFTTRTTLISTGLLISAAALFGFAVLNSFWPALVAVVVWALAFASIRPIRQAFINGEIPSAQRATVLSLDSMIGAGGSVILQPTLGRVADVYSYSSAYLMCTGIQLLALPFVILAKKEQSKSDRI